MNEFNLQLLSEEQEMVEVPEETADTGEQTPEEDFEALIRGRYKEQFDARVQKILDRRLRSLRQENRKLTMEQEDRRSRARDALARLAQQQESMQAVYPGFDWQRELRNPAFGRLITAGVDARTAYETVHRDQVLTAAMAYAARRSREQTARAVASGGHRVTENRGRSSSVSRSDPSTLTGEELADIRKRVFNGEKIRF